MTVITPAVHTSPPCLELIVTHQALDGKMFMNMITEKVQTHLLEFTTEM